jgi:hypothetical protein
MYTYMHIYTLQVVFISNQATIVKEVHNGKLDVGFVRTGSYVCVCVRVCIVYMHIIYKRMCGYIRKLCVDRFVCVCVCACVYSVYAYHI